MAANDAIAAPFGLCSVSNEFQGPLLNDRDADDDAFYATLVTPPTQGSLAFRYNGTFDYSANGSFSGTDSFTYKISDGYAESTATVTLSGRSLVANLGFSSARINFENSGTATPSGFLKDSGGQMGSRSSQVYGWNRTQSTTDRAGKNTDKRLDTFVAMDSGAKWQPSVPNGIYEVKTSLGDSGVASSSMILNVEGVNYFNGVSTAINQYVTSTKTVAVNDNWLTVDSGTSSSTKINYLDIVRLNAPGSFVASGPVFGQVNLIWADTTTNETGFVIERSTGGGGYVQIATPAANAINYADTGVTANTSYIYRIRAVYAGTQTLPTATTALTTYRQIELWRLNHFGSISTSGSAASLFKAQNGISNLMKFACNLGPDEMVPLGLQGNNKGMPMVTLDPVSQRLKVDFLRRKNSSNPGIQYFVEYCDDLAGWQASGSEVDAASLDNIWELVTSLESVLSSSATQRFGRVRVVKLP